MKWTPENDRKLLLLSFERDISAEEYETIAASYKEAPTPKAIHERLTRLRAERGPGLKELGITSDLHHDPTNSSLGVEGMDQTGDGEAQYYTRKINRKNLTIDRSRACVGDPQPHKTWIVTDQGQWVQYAGYSNLDWNDREAVEKVNKWREQALDRNGWYPQHRGLDGSYTAEQRLWLKEIVDRGDGTIKVLWVPQLVAAFNSHFGVQNTQASMGVLLNRLRKDIAAER